MEAYFRKQTSGSFFVQKHHVAVLEERPGVVVLRVCAGHLLHVVQKEPTLFRAKVEHAQDGSPVLDLQCAKEDHSAVAPCAAPGVPAFQDQHRVLQDLRDAPDLPQRHLRVVVQDLADLVPVHVDVALDRAQALQHRSRAA